MENYNDTGKKNKMSGGIIALIVIVAVIVGTIAGAGIIYAFTHGNGMAGILPTPTASAGSSNTAKPGVTIVPSNDPNVTALPDITAPPIDASEPIADIYDKMKDTVVLVNNYVDGSKNATGSGVIFTTDGYIITNYHVIEDATSITITMFDEREFDVILVGGDKKTDLAVLKIREDGTYHAAALGSSSALRVGQTVIAIGSPLGYSGTVTHGIVSSLNRVVDNEGNRFRMIQTDCHINPGNSGGPLFNLSGEVIGITSMKEVFTNTSDGQVPVEGIGYAIPIDTAKNIVLTLISDGEIKRGAIGIMAQTNVDNGNYAGVKVVEVTAGGPAAAAGVKVGDIIVEIDGAEITRMEELSEQLSLKSIGQTVTLKVLRAGQQMTFEITLSELQQ